MNRLQSAKNLAYRDARAWRRVALDFARINALSASRVQKLVAASLRDGQAGSDIGRQIERELEEASRVVAQRRNWILDQDAKDAESSSSSGKKPVADSGWTEVFDLDRTGFFFGSRTGRRDSGLGEYGRWEPRHASRHDDVSSASTMASLSKPKRHGPVLRLKLLKMVLTLLLLLLLQRLSVVLSSSGRGQPVSRLQP